MANIDACLGLPKSNEHYTPRTFLVRVYDFYGGELDLDPCSNSLEQPNTLANCHYNQALDGLKLPWFGKVFVNPPYGRSLPQWAQKAIEEKESKRADEILLLVPSRTDTRWSRSLQNYGRCYLSTRLRFLDEQGNEQDSAPFPSALFYLGDLNQQFKDYWSSLGDVWMPEGKLFDKRSYQRELMRKRRAQANQI